MRRGLAANRWRRRQMSSPAPVLLPDVVRLPRASLQTALLQTTRLRGRLTVAGAAAVVGDDALQVVRDLCDHGWLEATSGAFRLTRGGRERLSVLVAAERSVTDLAAVAALSGVLSMYDTAIARFPANVMHASDGEGARHVPNSHGGIAAHVWQIARLVPRYQTYWRRLERAVRQIAAAEQDPVQDTYADVWFELREDLATLLEGFDHVGRPELPVGLLP